jgi:hypothetical protein
MDRQIEIGLEGYLRALDGNRPEDLEAVASFRRQLDAAGEETRNLVKRMEQQSHSLRALRSPPELAPAAGFYARVLDRVEAQRQASFWFQFLDQRFSKTLAYASLALLFLLSATIFWSGSPATQFAQNPAYVMAEPEYGLDADQERNRATVLVDLATFEEY